MRNIIEICKTDSSQTKKKSDLLSISKIAQNLSYIFFDISYFNRLSKFHHVHTEGFPSILDQRQAFTGLFGATYRARKSKSGLQLYYRYLSFSCPCFIGPGLKHMCESSFKPSL